MTSTTRFFSGWKLLHNLREFEHAPGGLQQTGTRSAHRSLVASSERELRYIRDVMHRVANGIIDEVLQHDCDVIALENLTNIRGNTPASWGHQWAFSQLSMYIEYKTQAEGILVKEVPSAYTSKRCSECGATTDENRPTRDRFACQSCVSKANAEYNAAKNIGMRYVRRGRQSSRRTGNNQLASKSGTVTPKGGFTAYPDGFAAESMSKLRVT